MTASDHAPLSRLLLTGAAGGLGKVLRSTLRPFAKTLRLSDVAPMAPAGPGEEVVPCDLADRDAVLELTRDVDAILHFGGVSVERPFEEILEANLRGVFHIYEAARLNGVRRVVFASSNHVIGFYRQSDTIDAQSPRRPDGYYGLSKSFGEDMASFYFDRYGIETVSIRIGSSFPAPQNRRMLATWLSYADLTRLIERALFTPQVGHTVVFGMSDNTPRWWDNRHAAHLGFVAQDSSRVFQAEVERQPMPAADDPAMVYQGGAFVVAGPFEAPSKHRAAPPRAGAELVVDARNATGESPVWSAADNALYWVDIPDRALHRWDASDGRHAQWRAPEALACVARQGQDWVGGMESGIFALRTEADGHLATRPLARVEHASAGMRFNDGRCDRQGRFWAGTMRSDMAAAQAAGCLYRLDDAQASAQQVLDGFIVPNGLAFSPDGRTMYVSDSHPSVQQIWAFDYDPATGTPSNRRLFVDMRDLPGRPDGAAVDADGCYWICANDAGLVHRFTPDGRLDRSLALPVKKPTMCAFGGPGLRTLFVTSIRPGGDLSDQPLAGGVFALNPGVAGLPEPSFRG